MNKGWEGGRKMTGALAACGAVALICVLTVACSRQGIQVDYGVEGQSITPPPGKGMAEPAVNPSGVIASEGTAPASPKSAPSAMPAPLPEHWGQPPFDRLGFAMDPHGENNAASGRIYCPLPDGSTVRVELRYGDERGAEQAETLYLEVKRERVEYAFLLPSLSPQYVKLSAFWLPREDVQPQPSEVLALFGLDGEKISMPPAKLGGYGQRVLMESWVLPSGEGVEAAIRERLREGLPCELLESGWQDGRFVVAVDDYSAALSPAQREEMLCAAREAAEAYYPFGEVDLHPAVTVLDAAGSVLAQSGRPMTNLATDIEGDLADPVYVAGGERYHREDCRYAAGARKAARFAVEMEGYTPCKVCHP